jgi:hypothetical protein
MKTLEEAAKAVLSAWKSKDYLRPSIYELEEVLLYIANETKVKP